MVGRRQRRAQDEERGIADVQSWRLGFAWLRIWGVIFAALLVIGGGARLWYALRTSRWEGREPYRWVDMAVNSGELKRVVVFHYIPDAREVVAVIVPPDANIEAAGDYGDYRVGALYQLGQIEKLHERLLTASLEQLLAVFTQGAVVHSASGVLPPITATTVRVSVAQLVQESLLGRGNTYDRLRLWWRLKNLADPSVRVVDLAENRGFVRQTEADGSEGLVVNQAQLDALLKRFIVPGIPELAEVTVTLDNATDHQGLATQWSRFISMEGMDVVQVTDTAALRQQGALLFDTEAIRDGLGGRLLRQWFPDFLVIVTPLERYRSSVVIRLGDEVWQRVKDRERL